MLDKEVYTADGEKIEQGSSYFFVIHGNPVPIEVFCVRPGAEWSFVVDVDDKYDDDSTFLFAAGRNKFDVKNDSLFGSDETARIQAEQLYAYMVDSYKDKIHNLKDFIAFPLNINVFDNPAARFAYLSRGAELTGFYFTET